MLVSLDIRDMLLIDRLSLHFGDGLTAMTGETGAGKSILLDCLGFVLGARGRGQLVRPGAEQGEVTAVFELPGHHPAHDVLRDSGISSDDGELILRREVRADGRKSGFINDRRVGASVLTALGATLVEVQGQSEEQGLMDPRTHRDALDAFGGHGAALAELQAHYSAWRQSERRLRASIERQEALAAEEDFLRHAVTELDALAPEPGEEEALDAERRLMQAGARLREDIIRANDLLEQGAEGASAEALRWLETVSAGLEGQADGAIAAVERAMVELGEATGALRGLLEQIHAEPDRLEIVEERLFAIRALARKHHVLPEALAGLAAELRGKLAALEAGAVDLAAQRAERAAAEAAFQQAALSLRALRQEAATRLDAAIAAELEPLKLGRARFVTTLREAAPSASGMDEVAFEISTAPGLAPGALGRIASGGERSRFLLALKIALAEARASGPVMIFDEIDRGVGGATADAVGRRLRALAAGAQVLVVTHSPQVAACARAQWQVVKTVTETQTLSHVVPLSPEERLDELARMLSGDSVTEAARQAAQSLLDQVTQH